MCVEKLKVALRSDARKKAESLTPRELEISSSAIVKNFLALPAFLNAQNIFCYVSTAHEINTSTIIEKSWQLNKTVYVPRCKKNGIMHACRINSFSELLPAPFGLLEPPSTAEILPPQNIDLVAVPGLLFTKTGHRLGQGGGFYDRYLPQCTKATIVGLARNIFITKSLPLECML